MSVQQGLAVLGGGALQCHDVRNSNMFVPQESQWVLLLALCMKR